jgi:TRAP-type C4-dicarboxylate transport system permease small subunit
MPFLSRFVGVMRAVLLVIGAISLVIMMVVVVGNSVGRALFGTPILGTIEIAGLGGAIVVAAAVGFTAREKGNISVDLLMSRLRPRTRAFFDAVTYFLSLSGVLFLLYAVVRDAFGTLKAKEATVTMESPVAPFKLAWAAGILIVACFLIAHLVTAIRKVRKT